MANQFIQAGELIDYTPGSAVAAGAIVVYGDRVFVAPKAIAANELGSLHTCGVWKLAKTAGAAWTAGQVLYYDEADDEVTTLADTGTNKKIGYAERAAGSADTEGYVLLSV